MSDEIKNFKIFNKKNERSLFLNTAKSSSYNILFVVDTLLDNDINRNIVEFANYLSHNNVAVIIYTYESKIKMLIDKKVIVLTQNIFKKYSFIRNIFFFIRLKSICKNYNIDVINIFNPSHCRKIIKIAKHLKIKTISTIYSYIDIGTKWSNYLLNSVVKTDLIFINSDEICNFLLNRFNFDTNKLVKFNVGIDTSLFAYNTTSTERVKNVIKNIDVSIGTKKIFYCPCDFSDISVYKKLLLAINGINQNNFVILMSGNFDNNNENIKEIISIINSYNIQNKVKIINSISDKPALYKSCYIAIDIIQGATTFTKTSIEAGCMKKPSLMLYSQHHTTANVVDSKTGFIAKNNNILDIKNVLLKILNLSNEEYKNMCTNAYNYSIKHFNKQNIFSVLHQHILDCRTEKQKLYTKKNNILFTKFFY